MFFVRNLFVTSYKYFQLFLTFFFSIRMEWNGNTIVAVSLGILITNFNEN